jgi:glutamate/tyrosine decarboxylase-like PLP-dependent enzyme
MPDDVGSPATVAMISPRYFGFVIGGSMPVTVASNWLSTAWDQNVGMHEVTPAVSTLERVAMDWMIELFGLPKDSAAAFVTGATVANFSALAAARNRVVRAPVDNQGRIDIKRFPAINGPTFICTQAGNLNTGAFDPVGEICARAVDVWAALKSLGADGVAEMIDSCCSNARRFADCLEKAGYEILNEVVLNQVLVSFGDAATTRRVIDLIQEDGTCWCGITVWQEKTAMRISVCNWATTAEDVDRSLEAIIKIADQEQA